MSECKACAEKDVEIARLRGERDEFKDYYGTIVRSAKAAGLELDEKAPDYTVCESFRELVEARARLAEMHKQIYEMPARCKFADSGTCPHADRAEKAEAACGAMRFNTKLIRKSQQLLWDAVANGIYGSRSIVGDQTLNMGDALDQIEKSSIGKSAQAVIEAAQHVVDSDFADFECACLCAHVQDTKAVREMKEKP